MASMGRAWADDMDVAKAESMYEDAYRPPEKKIGGGTVALVGGGGALAAFGGRQWSDSKKVPQMQAQRAAGVDVKHAVNDAAMRRARADVGHLEAKQALSRRVTRWMHTGKVREARKRLETTTRAADQTKALQATHKVAGTPENVALRAKHMRRGGKLMLAGGIATATAPVWSRPFRKADDVSKTISQARYGSNAEMGRAWRGPEKKDSKSPTVAAAGLGVGAAGVGTALVGRRKLKNVGPEAVAAPARDEAGPSARHAHESRKATVAENDRRTVQARLDTLKQQDKDWRAGTQSRKHPHAGQPVPDYPGHKRGPAGKVGVSGGGFRHLEQQVADEAGKATQEAHFTSRAEKVASHELSSAQKHNATRTAVADAANAKRTASIKGGKRMLRGGKAVAAGGGLAALAAGYKAEKDRNTGWGRPRRRLAAPSYGSSRKINGL